MPSSNLVAQPDLVFVTKLGMAKRTPCGDFDVRSKRIVACALEKGDEIISVFPAPDFQDVLLITRLAQSIRIRLDTLPVQSRTSRGVHAMQLSPDDVIIFAAQIQPTDAIVLCTERGYCKCVPSMGFEAQGRNGKGVRCFALQKGGTNGRYLAFVSRVPAGLWQLSVRQAKSAPSLTPVSEIAVQSLTGKGYMQFDALFDNIVIGADLVPLQMTNGDL